HGTLSGTVPSLTYTPTANYNGSDTFRFSAAPGSEAVISIQITPVDDTPVALPQNVSTSEDQSLPITLTASDIDGGPVNWQIIIPPAHGALSGTAPNLTYTPAANFNGSDSFRFAAAPGSEAIISIQVTAVDDPPVALPQNLSTPEDQPLAITLSVS